MTRHAREDWLRAVRREVGDVAVQVVEVNNLEAKGLACVTTRRGQHLPLIRPNGMDGGGRCVADEQIEGSVGRAVWVWLDLGQAQHPGRNGEKTWLSLQ